MSTTDMLRFSSLIVNSQNLDSTLNIFPRKVRAAFRERLSQYPSSQHPNEYIFRTITTIVNVNGYDHTEVNYSMVPAVRQEGLLKADEASPIYTEYKQAHSQRSQANVVPLLARAQPPRNSFQKFIDKIAEFSRKLFFSPVLSK